MRGCNRVRPESPNPLRYLREWLEAPGGFEPPHRSFAACPRALRPMMINRDGQRRLIRKINKLWRFHYALPRLTRIPNREQNREWNRE